MIITGSGRLIISAWRLGISVWPCNIHPLSSLWQHSEVYVTLGCCCCCCCSNNLFMWSNPTFFFSSSTCMRMDTQIMEWLVAHSLVEWLLCQLLSASVKSLAADLVRKLVTPFDLRMSLPRWGKIVYIQCISGLLWVFCVSWVLCIGDQR